MSIFLRLPQDIKDTWRNTLMNAHNQIRLAEYQTCGQFLTPDMLTIGMGGQTAGEYRSQLYLWSILGAPLILSNDVRAMSPEDVALVSNPEVLQIDQDPDCVMGSLVRAMNESETWLRPLADGTFGIVLLNKGDHSTNITVFVANVADTQWGE